MMRPRPELGCWATEKNVNIKLIHYIWAKYICRLAKLVSLKCVKFTLGCHWVQYWTSPVQSIPLHPISGSMLGHFVWDLGWTKWHWDMFLPLGHRPCLGNIVPSMLHTHSFVYHPCPVGAILPIDSVVICLGLCFMFVCSPDVPVTYFDKNVCISRRFRACCMTHQAIRIARSEERE